LACPLCVRHRHRVVLCPGYDLPCTGLSLAGNQPDHRKPVAGRSARSPVAGLRSRPRLVGAGVGPGTTRPERAS
jgi:hypothetical protein